MYNETNSIFKKILTKLLKRFHIWDSIQPIDWYMPITLYMPNIDIDIKISNIDSNIILSASIEYINGYQNWEVLNELNNPLNQPTILIYSQIEEQNILIWSKQNIYELTIEDIEYWINLFSSIIEQLRIDMNSYKYNQKNLSQPMVNSFEFLDNLL